MQEPIYEVGTLDLNVVRKLEPPLKAPSSNAVVQERALLVVGLFFTANGQSGLLHLDLKLILVETGNSHGDTVLVLTKAFDIVGRIARIGINTTHRVEQLRKTIESDGGTIKGGKIELSHDIVLLERSDM